MGESVSAVEARQKLGEILNKVALLRKEIVIERAGKKIARLSPMGSHRPASGGQLDFRKAAGLGKEIWPADRCAPSGIPTGTASTTSWSAPPGMTPEERMRGQPTS